MQWSIDTAVRPSWNVAVSFSQWSQPADFAIARDSSKEVKCRNTGLTSRPLRFTASAFACWLPSGSLRLTSTFPDGSAGSQGHIPIVFTSGFALSSSRCCSAVARAIGAGARAAHRAGPLSWGVGTAPDQYRERITLVTAPVLALWIQSSCSDHKINGLAAPTVRSQTETSTVSMRRPAWAPASRRHSVAERGEGRLS